MPKLECLSPEAINNRFLDADSKYQKYFIDQMLKQEPWWAVWAKQADEERFQKLMKRKGMTETKARKIMKAEDVKWEKEYNSPLAVAQRKITELENRLEDIKRFINDPESFECP